MLHWNDFKVLVVSKWSLSDHKAKLCRAEMAQNSVSVKQSTFKGTHQKNSKAR